MKCPTPSLDCFSFDTDTTSSMTVSRSPSTIGSGNSASLAALMKVVPGSGTRIAIADTGGRPPGSHGSGVSQPITRPGGATNPPQVCCAKSGSQYDGLPSWTMAANNWILAALTTVPAVRGLDGTPT